MIVFFLFFRWGSGVNGDNNCRNESKVSEVEYAIWTDNNIEG